MAAEATNVQKLIAVSGKVKPPAIGIPNSIYTQLSSDGKFAVSNFVYDAEGNVAFQVDFATHGAALPGHGHEMLAPGFFKTGHAPLNYVHMPAEKLPSEYLQIPAGVQYSKPPTLPNP